MRFYQAITLILSTKHRRFISRRTIEAGQGLETEDARTNSVGLLSSSKNTMLTCFRSYCVRAFLFVCGFYWVQTKGRPVHNVPVVIANHPSMFEPFWFAYEYLPIAVSKADNGKIPIVGTVLR